mmetsp:Transcript_106934/g.284532  ORF Transcript_106934/g.284532 Transcript_106934/m.284532 type:complete len:329 (-) Transcript_106934:12-998(-)
MGASKCSQICDRGISRPCSEGIAQPGWPRPPSAPGPPGVCELDALSYQPPPGAESLDGLDALLGTQLPVKPLSRSAALLPSSQSPLTYSATSRSSAGPSCARAGEPVNKVYVQFSNDLEGFLPYTLVISEAMGLEFTSLSSSPDFTMDPLNILKADRVSYEDLMEDPFFVSLSKHILGRSEALPHTAQQSAASSTKSTARSVERVRPPYASMVQLSVRRTLLEGGQVLVFIAVQTELLAEELLRSCHRLKKRRAVLHLYAPDQHYATEAAHEQPKSPRGQESKARGLLRAVLNPERRARSEARAAQWDSESAGSLPMTKASHLHEAGV